MTAPGLTLIAIARNEAGWIQTLLNHHRPLYDRALVVDTGSRDSTPDLARSCGAEVVDFAWIDDFAAARNAGLDAAGQGGWALCIDADELIAPADFPRLRQALAGPPRVLLLEQRNYYNLAEHNEWQPVRGEYPQEEKGQTGYFSALNSKLFPLLPGLRWTGRVHEETTTCARTLGIPIEELDLPIHHYGYVKSQSINEERLRFYARLSQLKLADQPESSQAIMEAATALIQVGRAREALPLLERLDAVAGSDIFVARGRVLLAKLRAEEGRHTEVEPILERLLAGEPEWLFSWVEMARHYARCERWADLEALLARARAAVGDHPLFRKEEVGLFVNTRRLAEAAAAAEDVAALFPQFPEYRMIAEKCRRLREDEGGE